MDTDAHAASHCDQNAAANENADGYKNCSADGDSDAYTIADEHVSPADYYVIAYLYARTANRDIDTYLDAAAELYAAANENADRYRDADCDS